MNISCVQTKICFRAPALDRHSIKAVVLVLLLGGLTLGCNRANPADDAPVRFVWTGAVDAESAHIVAGLNKTAREVRLHYSVEKTMTDSTTMTRMRSDRPGNQRVAQFQLTDLLPNTRYFYLVSLDGRLDSSSIGTFKTFPPEGPASFSVAFGSCAATGSDHPVFSTIRRLQPLFFLHLGDMHYENIGVNDVNEYRRAWDQVLASNTQSLLYRSHPIAYIWDDHDFGPNNSDRTAAGRQAARLTYQEYVPHYPLPAGTGDVPIYQAFSAGRVRFILSDLRSARDPYERPDSPQKTLMGARQKQWFFDELLESSGRYPLIVWVSTLPWIGDYDSGTDGWPEYQFERREIAEFIDRHQIRGLCMLSGDAHMLAIDDGTNTQYAAEGGRGFPLMHAAALDRIGTRKGGPYSHGTYRGGGQFGLMTIKDNGGELIDVHWSGRTDDNEELLRYSFSVKAP